MQKAFFQKWWEMFVAGWAIVGVIALAFATTVLGAIVITVAILLLKGIAVAALSVVF